MTYLFHVDPRSVADSGSELEIQSRFRARMKMLAPRVRLVATPNGGKRTAWAAMKAKAEGMAKCFPDLTCWWSNGIGDNAIPEVAIIEFKDRDGPLAPEQIDWLNFLHRSGFRCGVFRSADTALAFMRHSGAPFMQEAA